MVSTQPSVVMSVLERDELDRLLNDTKTELFSQQRRAREELEGVQEVTCHYAVARYTIKSQLRIK